MFFLYHFINLLQKEGPFTLEDRERIIRMGAKLTDIDKRFEQIDKIFEQVGRQIDQFFNFLWILAVIFSPITAGTIGFSIWDRGKVIRPFEEKTKGIMT